MTQLTDNDLMATSKIQVFAYHEICSVPSRDIYTLSPEMFFQHLATISKTAEQSRSPAVITFDDGHCSNIRWAAPILGAFSLKANFFVTTNWIASKHDHMDWNDVRSLVAAGHAVGSHTASHSFLPQCSPSRMQEELLGSRRTLEDHIGQHVRTISLPGGRCNEAVLRACAIAGYEVVYTSQPGYYRPPAQVPGLTMPAVIGRFAVRAHTTLRTIAGYAEANRTTVHLLQANYRVRDAMKAVVGDAVYQRFWSHLFRATTN
ncbi:putative xylanase/chitin deacetylase [Terriglobus roseus DSM 18391]|uniref:Putative xylanase/chitin deacetylase n=1 Tax=Terriglobus roseus (strain DSM 18391 / NRRL B-41598 / KBS 63) TaxID=926566 RepID=I3ZE98_TERRK|nr:polysaccharide deacetylase family protein [Terriglobus roseus]AFL87566.1 putative xylanase/chitin deacetylase [Terriglobus roseus DSM 18391]